MTPAGLTFSRSQRTLADLQALAAESPAEAQHYLEEVKARLPETHARAVEELLAATGSLVERIASGTAQLGQVFAPAPDQWGALQAARAGSIGWQASAQATTTLTGKVTLQGETFVLDAPGLRPLKLAEGTANETLDGIPGQWVAGFMRDGDVRLQGTLGNDGLTFNVTGFAPVRPGYEKFTMARVVVDGDDVWLRRPSGERIELAGELRTTFAKLHRLAVILPGEPRQTSSGRVYDDNPPSYFALGRFRANLVQMELDGSITGFVDMAHEAIVGGPVRMPADLSGRLRHPWRVWLEGRLNRPFVPNLPSPEFKATYVSEMSDTLDVTQWKSVPLLPKVPEASPVDAARELASP